MTKKSADKANQENDLSNKNVESQKPELTQEGSKVQKETSKDEQSSEDEEKVKEKDFDSEQFKKDFQLDESENKPKEDLKTEKLEDKLEDKQEDKIDSKEQDIFEKVKPEDLKKKPEPILKLGNKIYSENYCLPNKEKTIVTFSSVVENAFSDYGVTEETWNLTAENNPGMIDEIIDNFIAENQLEAVPSSIETTGNEGQTEQAGKPLTENESLISSIREKRLLLDFLSLCAKSGIVHQYGGADEIYKSKMWLGKLLSFIGAQSPYANEKKIKTIQDIPPTAEQAILSNNQELNEQFRAFQNLNPLDAILLLRERLQFIADSIENDLDLDNEKLSISDQRLARVCKTNAWQYACEAKFDCGIALSKLRG